MKPQSVLLTLRFFGFGFGKSYLDTVFGWEYYLELVLSCSLFAFL